MHNTKTWVHSYSIISSLTAQVTFSKATLNQNIVILNNSEEKRLNGSIKPETLIMIYANQLRWQFWDMGCVELSPNIFWIFLKLAELF